MTPLFAFLHHLAAFTLFATLAIELVLLGGELNAQTARKIQFADMVLGIAAGALFVIGMLRVFYFEKGAGYYFHSAPFLAKLSLFIILGLLSIYPTIVFLKWRKSLKEGQAPVLDPAVRKKVRMIVHLELTGAVLIMLCAALMARGIGYFG